MEKSELPAAEFPHKSGSTENDGRKERLTEPWWKIGGKDISYVSVDAGLESETSSLVQSSGSSLVKNENNVFASPEATELYKPVAGFEGTHRFDPNATWTQAEEAALVRRVCFP